MTVPPQKLRSQLIPLVQIQIEAERSPRLAMMPILTASSISGFLTSVILLDLGMNSMACRYPFAVGAAYLVGLELAAPGARTMGEAWSFDPNSSRGH